jgi:hypothetical protein
MRRPAFVLIAAFAALASTVVVSAAPPPSEIRIDAKQWRLVERESGPVNYYATVDDPVMPFVRGWYKPTYSTAVLGFQIRDEDRQRIKALKWTWRAIALPSGGDECASGHEDSAAVVYVTWKRGLRWLTLKYVWSAVGTKGAVCDRKRNPFVAQDTIVLETGGPLRAWKSEEIDLRREFRAHFEDGRADAEVPDLVGLGIMSDGDQTKSESAADYAQFVLVRD